MPATGPFRIAGHRATFTRFALVGATVAVIDIAGFEMLHSELGIDVYLARIPSFALAMTAGYFLNRRFTFPHRRRSRHIGVELLRFYTVFAGGGLLNYAVFACTVAAGHAAALSAVLLRWLPMCAIVLGGLCGLCFNYIAAHRLVFDTP